MPQKSKETEIISHTWLLPRASSFVAINRNSLCLINGEVAGGI